MTQRVYEIYIYSVHYFHSVDTDDLIGISIVMNSKLLLYFKILNARFAITVIILAPRLSNAPVENEVL